MSFLRVKILNLPESKKTYLNFLIENDLLYDDYYDIYVDGYKLHTQVFGYKESTLKSSFSHHAKERLSKEINGKNSNFLMPLVDAFNLISNYRKRNLVQGIGINDLPGFSEDKKEEYRKWIGHLKKTKKKSTSIEKMLLSDFITKEGLV